MIIITIYPSKYQILSSCVLPSMTNYTKTNKRKKNVNEVSSVNELFCKYPSMMHLDSLPVLVEMSQDKSSRHHSSTIRVSSCRIRECGLVLQKWLLLYGSCGCYRAVYPGAVFCRMLLSSILKRWRVRLLPSLIINKVPG